MRHTRRTRHARALLLLPHSVASVFGLVVDHRRPLDFHEEYPRRGGQRDALAGYSDGADEDGDGGVVLEAIDGVPPRFMRGVAVDLHHLIRWECVGDSADDFDVVGKHDDLLASRNDLADHLCGRGRRRGR